MRGDTPVLDAGDVDALVAFLETLTDRDIPRRDSDGLTGPAARA
jgi:hypothetical protein